MKVDLNWDKFDSKLYQPLVFEEVPDYSPGTIAYDDFWDMMDDRCLNGYKPTPYMPKIAREHFFYLNMCQIELLQPGATRKTPGSPFYRELDRRLFNEIVDAKMNKYGLIVGKPRRVGLSWVGSATTVYELLFYREGKVGVAAGMEDKAQDFYEKVKYLLEKIHPEYRSGILKKNSEHLVLGYSYKENKQTIEEGIKSQMFVKTFFAKPTGFEGKSLNTVIFEEAGLFEDLIASYKSTEPCFKDGAIQFGTPLVYGTGGDIEKGSKGYKEMWDKHKKYNLKKVFIPAFEYYPGDGIPDPVTGEKLSFFDMRTGRTNQKAAYKYIMDERKLMEGAEGYIKHVQSYPVKEQDIFIRTSGGVLSRKLLNAQMMRLDENPYLIKQGYFKWKTDDPVTIRKVQTARSLKEQDKIHFQRGSKVEFIEDDVIGKVKKILDPLKKNEALPYHPDIGGSDSYDEEMAQEEREHASSGATLIYRTFSNLSEDYNLPVCYLVDRGDGSSDDEFYSQSLLMQVYYDSELLVEYTKIAIINYFKDVGAQNHLKEQPDLEGYNSKASNKYGWKVSNQHAKAIITKLLKAEVKENWNRIWFEEMLVDLLNYGDENTDLAMALGMCLVHKLDIFGEITEGVEYDSNDGDVLDDFGFWSIENGEAVWKTYRTSYDNDPYNPDTSNLWGNFNPEYDLSGEELQEYHERKIKERKIRKEEQDKLLDKYNGDIMGVVIDSYFDDV